MTRLGGSAARSAWGAPPPAPGPPAAGPSTPAPAAAPRRARARGERWRPHGRAPPQPTKEPNPAPGRGGSLFRRFAQEAGFAQLAERVGIAVIDNRTQSVGSGGRRPARRHRRRGDDPRPSRRAPDHHVAEPFADIGAVEAGHPAADDPAPPHAGEIVE